jgi:hypothetical protein
MPRQTGQVLKPQVGALARALARALALALAQVRTLETQVQVLVPMVQQAPRRRAGNVPWIIS